MEKRTGKTTRKKFLVDGVKGLAVVGLAMAAISPIKKNKTVKMLTDSGKLVEINEDHLRFKQHNETASSKDIENWIKR